MSEARRYANIFLAAADGLDGPPYPDCQSWTNTADEIAQARAFRGIGRMFAKIADAEDAISLQEQQLPPQPPEPSQP